MANSIPMPSMEEIFPKSRIPMSLNIISVFLYFPIGFVLAIARMFLAMNYLCCQFVCSLIIPPLHPVQHYIQRVFLAVMGIVIFQENEGKFVRKMSDPSYIIVCNQNTCIDAYVLPCLLNTLITTTRLTLSRILQSMLRKFPCSSRTQAAKVMERSKVNPIHFPEDCPSSNKALLKFNDFAFALGLAVQPCCVKLVRYISVRPTTAESNWFTDMFWMFFGPFTIYRVKYLPLMRKSIGIETESDFALRVQRKIANQLSISRTNITLYDRNEYIKRSNVEVRRIKISKPVLPEKFYPVDIVAMVKKVKEVLSDVPFHVIATDLQSTYCVDTTITNIVEGVVKYTPISVASSEDSLKTFESSPEKRQLSFNERKELFIRKARENYLKKHPEYNKKKTD